MRLWHAVIFAALALPVKAQPPADLVVFNAVVRTMDAAHPKAEAIAINGTTITDVGTTIEIRRRIGPLTKTIDAGGRLVLPGFNDAHVHFAAIGNRFSSIDLRDVTSAQELSVRLAQYARFLPKGRWIIGGQWDTKNWPTKNLPTKAEIDGATPDNPVFLYNSNPNTALVNSKALSIARITAATKDPDGGTIVRDVSGSPTGILKGKAVDLVRSLVPANHERDWPSIIETASNYAASLGVTSVQDTHSDDLVAVYAGMPLNSQVKTRVYDCIASSNQFSSGTFKASKQDGGYVRRGCVKTFSEGDDDWTPELRKIIFDGDAEGRQIAIHAIGPVPNKIVAGILEELVTSQDVRDRRIRIEHAERADSETIRKFGRMKVVASVQPFLFSPGGSSGRYYRKLLEAGALLAMGSDAPMTDFSPLRAIQAAAANGDLTVEQAVLAYTSGSAYAEFAESRKGTIAKGMLADIVILSHDIFTIDPTRIGDTRVIITILDGKVIYDENKFPADVSHDVSVGRFSVHHSGPNRYARGRGLDIIHNVKR